MRARDSRRKSRRTKACKKFVAIGLPSILLPLTRYKEFAKLADDANIYKLVGPVLMKQDRKDAVIAVDSRLEYIGNELYVFAHARYLLCSHARRKRREQQITDFQERSEKKKMDVSITDAA